MQDGLIERGRTTGEEYERLMKEIPPKKFWSESGDESFWGIRLNDEYFIFCNNTLEFFGHHIVGRVGVHKDFRVNRKKTVEYFISIDEKEQKCE